MASPFAGKAIRYLIGADKAADVPGCVVEAPYGVRPPAGGIWYLNLLDQRDSYDKSNNTGLYGPYLPATGTAKEYGEGIVDPAGPGWPSHISSQLINVSIGDCVEWDNTDAYPIEAVLRAYASTTALRIGIAVKNPGLLRATDVQGLLRSDYAQMIIIEQGAGSPDEMHALRVAVGKPDLPVRFVSFGNQRSWAQSMAQVIRAKGYSDMGVTFDAAAEEYGGQVEDVLLPTIPPPGLAQAAAAVAPIPPDPPATPPRLITGADIAAKARSYVGQFNDGPDVPKMALEIGRVFPDLAAYCAEAYNDMPWCGDFVAYVMTQFGIKPPGPDSNGVGFFYVDRWQAFGTPVTPGQQQPGDVIGFIYSSLHHVCLYAGNGKYVGGNQSDAVTVTAFSATPSFVRRPPSVVSGSALPSTDLPSLIKPPGHYEKCLELVLKYEGGYSNDAADPGGPTNYGITIADYRQYINPNGTASDVQNMSLSDAQKIYKAHYWDALSCDQLPVGVDFAVFDYGVNSGISRSAKVLQGLVGADVDGEIGPETISQTRAASALDLVRKICDERLAFLRGLSTWGTFGKGWSSRVNDVRANALQMAAASPPSVAVSPAVVTLPSSPGTPPATLPPANEAEMNALMARFDQCVLEIRTLTTRVTALEAHMPKATLATPPDAAIDPATQPPAPHADPAAVLARLVPALEKIAANTAAHPPKQSPLYGPIQSGLSMLPGVGVFSSVIAYVLVAILQSHGTLGTFAGLGGDITTVGTAATTATVGAGMLSGLAWISQMLGRLTKPQTPAA
jgi:lysozyme family protein